MERCEVQVGGVDCGKRAEYVVQAGPRLSDVGQPFFACVDHPQDLREDLRSMPGWWAREPRRV